MKTPRPTKPVAWILCLYLAVAGLLPAGFECADASCDQPRWVTECSLPDFGAPELAPGCGCPAPEAEPCRLRQDSTSPATLRLTQLRPDKHAPGTASPPGLTAGLPPPPRPLRECAAQPTLLATGDASPPLFLQHCALLC